MMIAPAGIVVDALPLNLRARLVVATMAASLARSATLAAPTTSGAVPKLLLRTTRSRSPPRVGWTISRNVWLLKLRTGGGPGGGPGGGAACGGPPAATAGAGAAIGG